MVGTPVETRAAVRRVRLPDGTVTHTVVGGDGLPLGVVEEYLAYLRASEASPHTVQAYARGLASWWQVLGDRGYNWKSFPSSALGDLISYLATGDLPSVLRVGVRPVWLAPASRSQRVASVHAFYRWAQAAHGVQEPIRRLFTPGRSTGRYAPMLTGVGPAPLRRGEEAAGLASRGGQALYPSRAPAGRRPPVLTPGQVQMVLEACRESADSPEGRLRAARDHLLFALLPETGLRIGEALSLRHCDWHVGAGDTPSVEVVPRQDHPHGARVKNGRGRRLFVSDQLEALYSAYVWALVDAGIDLDVADVGGHWVFVNVAAQPRWAPMRPDAVYERVRAVNRRRPGQLPAGWSPHWMRHTHATALLLAGCPPHVVMRRLGHADVQTTLSTYGWVTEDAEMRSLAEWQAFASSWRTPSP